MKTRTTIWAFTALIALGISLITLWSNRDVFYLSTQVQATIETRSTNIGLSIGSSQADNVVTQPTVFASTKTKHTISIINPYQKDTRGLGSEVWVFQVLIDGTPIPWSDFQTQGSWESRVDGRGTDKRVLVSYKPGTRSVLSYSGASPQRIDVVMLSHPWSGKAIIAVDGKSSVIDLYSPVQRMYNFKEITGNPVFNRYTFDLPATKVTHIRFNGEDPNSSLIVKDVVLESNGHYINVKPNRGGSNEFNVPVQFNRSPFYRLFLIAGCLGFFSMVTGLGLFAFNLHSFSVRHRNWSMRNSNLVGTIATATLVILMLLYLAFFASRIAHAPFMADDYSNMSNFQQWASVRYELFRSPQYARGFIWVIILYTLLKTNSWFAHLINLAVYMTNCGILVYLYRKLSKRSSYGMSLTFLLLMVINPFAVESLLWLTAGYPIYVLFFSLCAATCVLHYSESGRKLSLAMFTVLSACAYFTNEQGLIIFPLYIYCLVFTRQREITARALLSSKKSIIVLLAFWITPYVLYRIFLLVGFHTTSAVQSYAQHYGLMLILSIYGQMLDWLLTSSRTMEIFTAVIALLLVAALLVRPRTAGQLVKRSYLKTYEFCLWAVLFLCVLIAPFSLLGGWLEHRFFYICSSLFLLFMFVFQGQVGRAYKFFVLAFGKNRRWTHVIDSILFIGVFSIAVRSTAIYAFDVLQPVSNLNRYVDNFIRFQNNFYKDLPGGSIVFMDIQEPTYTVPKYYDAASSIRLAWVPPALSELKMVKPDVTVLLLNGLSPISTERVSTVLAPWFIPQNTLMQLETPGRKYYLTVYDGASLIHPQHSFLEFINNNGRPVAQFSIPG